AVFNSLSFLEETDEGVVEKPADPTHLGDVVLGRKDSGTSYHLSSVLDDAEQGVTHVTRGEDLREAAALHVLLHRLMGLTPPVYRHHRLILDSAGKRLAKRDKSATLRHMREIGVTADEVRTRLFPA
ncbi:MAG: tRNA glutamyl-Q(34) synthetase GluQRS, partial [Robiginitomaculum sp.]|nr:tRNA glutamyl-Q(34) synthetase GluQRS [Robiginitomaculum sp.]